MRKTSPKQRKLLAEAKEHSERVGRVYERFVCVYDLALPGGKFYRWDTLAEARRFAAMNRVRKLIEVRLTRTKKNFASHMVDSTTPPQLLRKAIKRHKVRNQPHVVNE